MGCRTGEIHLIERLYDEIAPLYMSEECSDITLYIEGQKIPAHRSIIGARCEYLKYYFSNYIKCELDAPLEAFQVLLKYFYTGQMNLSKITNFETLIQILNLIEEYCLFYLKMHFENYFKQIITVENTCRLLNVAKTYELKELEMNCLNFIDTNADQIIASESFKEIHKDLLEDILTRDTFNASSELLIFHAVEKWSKHANQNIENVIHLVRLPLIPLEELIQIRKSGTLNGDIIFDAIEEQMTKKCAPRSDIQRFGKLLDSNENVASLKYNVRTVQGGFENDYEIKYRNRIGDGSGIIIELGQIFIINNLKIYLSEIYSYYIEISTDQKKWERIIDYSSFKCHSLQNLYFPSKPVKYIKIVGTLPLKTFFNVGTFEAYYRENIPEIRNGIVVPKEKVEYFSYGDLLMHNTVWQISLNQPYYIGSMRFYIDGGNLNTKYKFFIETSCNEQDWEKVADKRDEFVNDWQTFQFTSKPIAFIRMIPTAANGAVCNFQLNKFRTSIMDLNLVMKL